MTSDALQNLPAPISVIHRDIPAMAGLSNYQHPCTQIIFVQNGVLSVISDLGRYIVPPQQAILIPAQSQLELIAKSDVKLTFLYFDQQQAEHFQPDIAVLSLSTFIQSLIIESQTIKNDYLTESQQGRLLRLIRDYLANTAVLDTFLPYPKDERLTNITEKLLKHPSLKSDLNSWGKFVNASPRTLSRLFKKETGLTYSTWRQRLNVQIAIKHLAIGDSVGYIATLLGYESSSAFIFMFKKQMGVSPNQFIQSKPSASI